MQETFSHPIYSEPKKDNLQQALKITQSRLVLDPHIYKCYSKKTLQNKQNFKKHVSSAGKAAKTHQLSQSIYFFFVFLFFNKKNL